MAVEGGAKCIKYLLFFFNFLFWICGLALIILGVLAQLALNNTLAIEKASVSAVPLVVIVVGVIVFFIAFFGCCGAFRESHCMITTFSVLLSFIVLIQIGAAIAGYIYRGKLNEIVDSDLKDMVSKYTNSSAEFKKAVDEMQKDLKCCGMNSSADWTSFGPDGTSVPDSCCIKQTLGCGKGAMQDADKVYQKGCLSFVKDYLRKNVQLVIVAAVVIAFLQVLGIVFACILMKSIRSGYQVM
ncbi:CD63 antigen-like [Anguilla anguilla]|uniref:CD63 antigen-like n=1 Tax=Anguilla anguilla TaxID=7936 RepID=UPI0015B2AA5C|nr:CD63 antigen-like [Anguilla anguilla]XP_035244137.1 CD63 antigen-like [Anguilla anguilla]